MLNDYTVWIRDEDFELVRPVTMFTDLHLVEKDQDVGAWSLTIPAEAMTQGGGDTIQSTVGAGIVVFRAGSSTPVFGGRLTQIEHTLNGYRQTQYAPTATVMYMGGTGEGITRAFGSATEYPAAQWPWRIERFQDSSQPDAELDAEAVAALQPMAEVVVPEILTRNRNKTVDEWTFSGVDDMGWLRDRVILPTPSDLTPPWADEFHDYTGTAADAIRSHIRWSMGDVAHATRQLTGLDIGTASGDGATITKSGRLEPLLELCQNVANANDVTFRLGTLIDGVQIVAADRNDVSSTVVLSPKNEGKHLYGRDYTIGDLVGFRFDDVTATIPVARAETRVTSTGASHKVGFAKDIGSPLEAMVAQVQAQFVQVNRSRRI